MIVENLLPILGRLVGHYTNTVFSPAWPVMAVSCAGDVYSPTPMPNRNGELIEERRHLALAIEPGGTPQRLVYVLASSQFLYPNVRLLGRYLGEAEAGEPGESRPVYAIATCRGCLAAADYFNRPDADNPSETWNEEVGQAAIADGKLITTDEDARFWYWRDMLAPNLGESGEQWTGDVTVTLSATEAGAEATVLAGRNAAGEIYLAISWRFDEDDGKLLIRYFQGSSELTPNKFFANSSWDSTILFEGHGVAHPVTIRVCWNNEWNNVGVTRLDGSVWWASYTGVGLLLGGHGVGSRDVPGGQVEFDDYKASFGLPIIFGNPTTVPGADHSGCPTCQRCHGCPDDQRLCLRLPDQAVILERTGALVTGMAGFYSHGWDDGPGHDCGWQSDPVTIDYEECIVSAVLMLQVNGYWVIRIAAWVNNSLPGEFKFQYVRVLGRDAPRCDEWLCLDLYDVSRIELNPVTINWTPEFLEEEAPLAGANLSSGDTCEYDCYAVAPEEFGCCASVTLPGTLTMNAWRDGTPIQEDTLLDGGQNPPGNSGGFEYASSDELNNLTCIGSLPESPEKITIIVFDPDEAESVAISGTIVSCEPLHIVGTREFGGFLYEVEVTA